MNVEYPKISNVYLLINIYNSINNDKKNFEPLYRS